MWEFLNQYFNFTHKERKGILYILVIGAILIFIPFLFPLFIKNKTISVSEFEKEIAMLQIDSSAKKTFYPGNNQTKNNYTDKINFSSEKKYDLFYFDPNTATVKDWMLLGIREKTANTIQNYISKGGKFYKPEDIKKIWGLNETDANRLIPYVVIKKNGLSESTFEKNKPVYKPVHSEKKTVQEIDINTADSTALISLPGIGSKLAKRIIAFREKLGGFYSVSQVGETYLLPDSTFQKIKTTLVINSKAIKKININSATIDEMKSHPYIRYYLANSIFQYRQQHGNYNSVEEIKKIMTVTDEIYQKTSPYFTID